MTFDLRFVSSFARSSARAAKVLLAAGVAEGCEGSARCEGCGRPRGFSSSLITAKLQLAVEVPSLPRMLCSTRGFMSSPRRLPMAARIRLTTEVAVAARWFGLWLLRRLQCVEVAVIYDVWNLRMRNR